MSRGRLERWHGGFYPGALQAIEQGVPNIVQCPERTRTVKKHPFPPISETPAEDMGGGSSPAPTPLSLLLKVLQALGEHDPPRMPGSALPGGASSPSFSLCSLGRLPPDWCISTERLRGRISFLEPRMAAMLGLFSTHQGAWRSSPWPYTQASPAFMGIKLRF